MWNNKITIINSSNETYIRMIKVNVMFFSVLLFTLSINQERFTVMAQDIFQIPQYTVQAQYTPLTPVEVPDGFTGKLAWSSNGRIVVLNLETGEMGAYGGLGGLTSPQWFPDGHRLVVSESLIWILNTQDATFQLISPINPDRPTQDRGDYATVSPDGHYIVYRSANIRPHPIFVNLQTGTLTPVELITDIDGTMGGPTWINNSNRVSFNYGLGMKNRTLVTINTVCMAQGQCNLEEVPLRVDGVGGPEWHPNGMSFLYASGYANFEADSGKILNYNLVNGL